MINNRPWWYYNHDAKFSIQDLCIELVEKGKIQVELVYGIGNGLCVAEQLWAEREKLA